ncbi:MAG TPA: hypothetical protein VEH02_01040 [Pseudolabrys sp.]|nr:hypothetical protein [Pseudolabrys sp.]
MGWPYEFIAEKSDTINGGPRAAEKLAARNVSVASGRYVGFVFEEFLVDVQV